MNILEHILAGHYEIDGKGRTIVPMSDKRIAVIATTDAPGPYPIVAVRHLFGEQYATSLHNADGACIGENEGEARFRLLPPAPRKVKVTRWAVMLDLAHNRCLATFRDRGMAEEEAQKCDPKGTVVELTGESEELWL